MDGNLNKIKQNWFWWSRLLSLHNKNKVFYGIFIARKLVYIAYKMAVLVVIYSSESFVVIKNFSAGDGRLNNWKSNK